MGGESEVLKQLSDLHLSGQELIDIKKSIDFYKQEKARIGNEIEILKKSLEENKKIHEAEQSEHLDKIKELKSTIGVLVSQKDNVEFSTKNQMVILNDKGNEIEQSNNLLLKKTNELLELKAKTQKDIDTVNAKIEIIRQITELAKDL